MILVHPKAIDNYIETADFNDWYTDHCLRREHEVELKALSDGKRILVISECRQCAIDRHIKVGKWWRIAGMRCEG